MQWATIKTKALESLKRRQETLSLERKKNLERNLRLNNDDRGLLASAGQSVHRSACQFNHNVNTDQLLKCVDVRRLDS